MKTVVTRLLTRWPLTLLLISAFTYRWWANTGLSQLATGTALAVVVIDNRRLYRHDHSSSAKKSVTPR